MSKWWKIIVIGILGLTALSKILSLLNPTKLLVQNDPVFGIPITYVMAGASLFEIGICIFLGFTRDKIKAALAVFAFAVLVLSYRVGIYVNGIHYCPCLGNLVDWWPWLGSHEGSIMASIAFWLLLTSSAQLFQRDSKGKPFNHGSRFSLIKLIVPIGLVGCLSLWLDPWKNFSCGLGEGVELSRMQLLFHHLESHRFAWNDMTWFYSQLFASVFSITGFHFWIPRLATLAIIGVVWMIFPRLMPGSIRWPHLVSALVFFCSWPSMIFLLASATPQLPAFGLAVVSAALLPRHNEQWRVWKFVVSGVLLTMAVWVNVFAAIVLPAIVITLTHIWWSNIRPSSINVDLSAAFIKKRRLVIGLGASVFVVLSCLIVWRGVFLASIQNPDNQVPTGIAQKTANFLFGLSGLLKSPGTLLGAFWGVVVLKRQRRLLEVAFLLTLSATILIFHLILPGWYYYLAYLAVPVAVLAGFGVGELYCFVVQRVPPSPNGQQAIINCNTSMMLGALVISLWLGFEYSNGPRGVLAMREAGLKAGAALDVLYVYQNRVNWIYTSDISLAAHAGISLPPELIDISQEPVVVSAANQTFIFDTIKKYQCELLMLRSNEELRDKAWLEFVKKEYTEIWSDGSETIFAANRLNSKQYPKSSELLKRLIQ